MRDLIPVDALRVLFKYLNKKQVTLESKAAKRLLFER